VGRATKAVEILVFVGLAVTGLLVTAAVSVGTGRSPGDPHGWAVAAGVVFGATVLVAILYFLVHPGFLALDKKRAEWINAARAGRPQLIPKTPRKRRGRRASSVPADFARAEYGASGAWNDVTAIARRAMGYGDDLPVTNDTIGGDPIEGTPKVLRLTYEDGSTREIPENGTLKFPL